MARFTLSGCCQISADIFLLIFFATLASCSSLPHETLFLTDPQQPLILIPIFIHLMAQN
jgi:hypothetical protein